LTALASASGPSGSMAIAGRPTDVLPQIGDTCAGKGLCDIPGIAAELLSTPIWTFWWN